MILHHFVFPTGYPLLQVLYFDRPGGPTDVYAPAAAVYVRAGVSGAGGFKDDVNGWGGGAAFAFAEEACAGGDHFTVQVGDTRHSRASANDVLGDSWVRRGDSSILVYADRGRPDGSPGLAANSTGSITRSGAAATSGAGGASAGDDADPFPMGFGGTGASPILAPWYGGGGGHATVPTLYPVFPAGDGLACLEFYSQSPGI